MDIINSTPKFNEAAAAKLTRDMFGIDGTCSLLTGERDQNFRVEAADGTRYILKIANGQESRAILEAENAAMLHLAQRVDLTPRVLDTVDGGQIGEVVAESGSHLVRLVSFLNGTLLAKQRRQSAELHRDLGRAVGQVDHALTSFDHRALHRHFHWDLANAGHVVAAHKSDIADAEVATLVAQISTDFAETYAPRLGELRQSIIHNDGNDYNVLVGGGNDLYTRNQTVTGIIDFGDAVHTHTVNGLAIAVAYAVLDKPDPLDTACHIVAGYNAEHRLTDVEFELLWPLVLMRLCVSASLAGYQMKQRPDDPYLAVSQAPIKRTLPKLVALHPRYVAVALRLACGMVGRREAAQLERYLRSIPVADIFEGGITPDNTLPIDWSVSSPLISGPPWETDTPAMTAVVKRELSAAGKPYGIGGYGQVRLIYNDKAFDTGDKITDERRTVHLGVDLFAPAGTAVFAPLAGEVVSAETYPAPLDYGHAVILQHSSDDGLIFYSMYGHLSASTLDHIAVGDRLEAGDRVGWLGDESENGGWTAHLHFHLMTDLLGYGHDVPTIAPASKEAVWREFLPDVNLLLRLPDWLIYPQKPTKAETLQTRRTISGGSLSIGYRDHAKMLRGWMQYLYDETGRRYIDAYNNVPHVGHCHPHVVEAIRRQVGVLNTNTRYLQDEFNRYASRLADTFPDPLNVVYLVNSGSEANELALRLARAATGQRDLIVNEGAYHGHSTTLIDISPYKHAGPGGEGAPDWVHTVPVADIYRGQYRDDEWDAGELFANDLDPVIAGMEKNGRRLCGFIHETCPSVGGQIIFPDGYLQAAYRKVRAAGGVCIADEVQTGFGRIGTHFYAFSDQGVVPDIVVLGKPIGNGHPLAAVVTTREIADAFDNGMEFFATFGGNTVSCAAGNAVLDVLAQDNGLLQANALAVGEHLLTGLMKLQQQFELIGDVRGSGFFIGMELVHDRATLAPAAAEASFISNEMRRHGILLGTDGPLHNVVKIRPPMPFSMDDAELLLFRMSQIFTAMS